MRCKSECLQRCKSNLLWYSFKPRDTDTLEKFFIKVLFISENAANCFQVNTYIIQCYG